MDNHETLDAAQSRAAQGAARDNTEVGAARNSAEVGAARKQVDLIVPCYNEAPSVRPFYDAASAVARSIPQYAFRFIFIDDGSSDGTLDAIRELQSLEGGHESVAYISFSRNFGKEAGIYAGLRHSTGDFAAVIDADLQHPPELLRGMLLAVDGEGYDSSSARRVSREGEPRIRSMLARAFYRFINRMSDVDIVDGAVDYRLMSRQMVDAVLELSEVQRFSKGIFAWVGFRTKWVEFKNVERVVGETKWSFWKLFGYAIDGIAAFTTVPLRFASVMGLAMFALSFILMAFEFVKTIARGVSVPGYPSTLIMLLLIGGVMALSMGILGEYVARTYMEAKRRPVYVAKRIDTRALGAGDAGKDMSRSVSAATPANSKEHDV